jgi:hypothetical protein
MFLLQSIRPFLTIHRLFFFFVNIFFLYQHYNLPDVCVRNGCGFPSFFHTLTSASVCLVLSSHLITISFRTAEFSEKMIHSSPGSRFVWCEIELKTGTLFILLDDHCHSYYYSYYYYYYYYYYIVLVITFMQAIYNYTPETNHVSAVYNVAAVL